MSIVSQCSTTFPHTTLEFISDEMESFLTYQVTSGDLQSMGDGTEAMVQERCFLVFVQLCGTHSRRGSVRTTRKASIPRGEIWKSVFELDRVLFENSLVIQIECTYIQYIKYLELHPPECVQVS